MKKINLITAAILITVVGLLIVITPHFSSAAPNPPQAGGEVDPALEQALQDKLAGYQSKLAGTDKIGFTSTTYFSQRGVTSYCAGPGRQGTGKIIETEPALAIGIRDNSKTPGWKVILQSDQQWDQELSHFPSDQLPEDMRNFLFGAQAEVGGLEDPSSGAGLDSTLAGTVYAAKN